jgi:hypothetical protein
LFEVKIHLRYLLLPPVNKFGVFNHTLVFIMLQLFFKNPNEKAGQSGKLLLLVPKEIREGRKNWQKKKSPAEN